MSTRFRLLQSLHKYRFHMAVVIGLVVLLAITYFGSTVHVFAGIYRETYRDSEKGLINNGRSKLVQANPNLRHKMYAFGQKEALKTLDETIRQQPFDSKFSMGTPALTFSLTTDGPVPCDTPSKKSNREIG